MSSGLECMFFEYREGEWYYALESGFGQKNAFDWRDEADTYGPFPDEETACSHLMDNHSNPGGWSTITHQDMPEKNDAYTRLVEEAPEHMKMFEQPSNVVYRRW